MNKNWGEDPTDHILKEGSDPPRLSAQTERDPDTRQTGGTGRSVLNRDRVRVGWRGHANIRRNCYREKEYGHMAQILVGQWLETVVAEYTNNLTHPEFWLMPKSTMGLLLRNFCLPS